VSQLAELAKRSACSSTDWSNVVRLIPSSGLDEVSMNLLCIAGISWYRELLQRMHRKQRSWFTNLLYSTILSPVWVQHASCIMCASWPRM
jgi:hypothetical protein